MVGGREMRKILGIWCDALRAGVAGDGPDLSARQMAILLTVYLRPPPHTVRGFAAELNISKPAVTRALDTMAKLGLIRRKRDQADGRNVLIQPTVRGSVYLSEFADSVGRAGRARGPAP